jgi:hypothetical protein
MTQKIQQQYRDSQIQQQNLYEAAKVGIAEGAAGASADSAAGTLALLQGGSQVVGQAFGDFNKGMFSGTTQPGPADQEGE